MALVRVQARGIGRQSEPRQRSLPAGATYHNNSMYDGKNSPYISSWSQPPKRNVQEWLQTYSRSPRLSVVNKIAEDLAFATGKLIYKNVNGEDEELPENHPFLNFWNTPNPLPQFTKEALWQLHQEYLLLTGESYMIIEKDYFGYPAELWPISPHWVMGTPTAGNPFYSIRTPSNLMAQVHVNDMFVQMELNPEDPYGRGLGRAQSIADEVEIDEYASMFEKRFFYNDATPSSIIAIENADADAVKRFEASWNNIHRGVANSHRTAVTSGKVSAAKLADNMKDLDMINGRVFLRNSVLEHFHMPREIMGITENSNRSTAEAAQYIYAQNVLTPYIRKRQSAINIQLTPYWREDIRYVYDEIVPRNQEFDKGVATEGWSSGLLTLNEARKKLDFESLDNGDVLQAPLLFSYINTTQKFPIANVSPEIAQVNYDSVYEVVDPVTGAKEFKASISHLDQQAMLQLERAQRQQERHAENVTTQYLSRQRRNIIREFRDSVISSKSDAQASSDFAQLQLQLEGVSSPIARAEILTGFVERMALWQQDEKELKELLSNIWSSTYEQGKGIMENLYDLKNPYNPQTRDVFKRMGGQKISSDISGTTKDSIIKIIDNGLAEGLDVNTLADQIGASADLSPYRAKLIAKQETYNALSASNYDSMKEGGAKRHKWVTRGDELVRSNHRLLNGQIRQIGEKFSNGLLHPRDREGSAPEVVNCRCWAVPLRERDTPFVPD